VQQPSRPLDGAFKARFEPTAINIIRDDILPTVAPGRNMIDGVAVLHPQSSRYGPIEPGGSLLRNK
jgi:hypothetical protein